MSYRRLAVVAMNFCSMRWKSTLAGQACSGSRVAAPLPARAFPASLWGRIPAWHSAGQQQGAQGGPSAVAVRSYAYDAATAAPGAEIGEVDFDQSIANTVRLIGTVGNKRELKVFERSKLLPFSVGLKDKRRPDELEWVNVEVWGPLAERAEQEIQKGDRVALQGWLKIDAWTDRNTGMKRTAVKIVANSLSKVRRTGGMGMGMGGAAQEEGGSAYGSGGYAASSGPAAGAVELAPWDLPQEQQQQPGGWDPQPGAGQQQQQQQAQQAALSEVEQHWMDYFEAPDQWWDNRASKPKPNSPDFKKKAGGREAPALWLNDKTPAWVHRELERKEKLGSF